MVAYMSHRVGLLVFSLAAIALGAPSASATSADGRPRVPLVVIDAGHGGPNHGARALGQVEKEVTLDVARRIADRLEAEAGVRVVLTREGDWHLPLRDRPEMANQLGADAFLSIHCNASDEVGPHGFETWFLPPEGSRQALQSEKAQRVTSRDDVPDTVRAILGDLVSQGAHQGGRRLAESVHEGLAGAAPEAQARGIRQGAYTVLVAATMPSTVVEMGFLNHPDEGSALATPSYRSRMARGISAGIVHFLRRTGRLRA